MGDGTDPQVEGFIQSLQNDGWTIASGRLERGQLSKQNGEVRIPEHSRVRSDLNTSRRVFIVHGRDNTLKNHVTRAVHEFRYEPCILGSTPNRGQTVIEKLAAEAQDAAFAIVLLTPDDEGRLAGETGKLEARARQNVIFEWGFLIGLIGRNRVAAMSRGDVDLPSNLLGIACIKVTDDSDGWKMRLVREMRAAGLDIDSDVL
ncbi:nucleotide-binding protein [Micromonospora sp. NPDC085948]|uniref:nucleotide-binding protein n=1 Tax=Micromonospora sp. NPDC085948 TaxID=3155293 RepID=UPI003441BB03